MKEGDVIKLRASILPETDTTGRLMEVVGFMGGDVLGKPIGKGWSIVELDVDWFYINYKWIDNTYKHKENEP